MWSFAQRLGVAFLDVSASSRGEYLGLGDYTVNKKDDLLSTQNGVDEAELPEDSIANTIIVIWGSDAVALIFPTNQS